MRVRIPTNYDYEERDPINDLVVERYLEKRNQEKTGVFYNSRKGSKKNVEDFFSSTRELFTKDLSNKEQYSELLISSVRRESFDSGDGLIIRTYQKKNQDKLQYHIQTGLYTGVLYYPVNEDILEFHIIPKFGKVLLNRMLNLSNHVYVNSSSVQSSDSKNNEDYFAYIIEYLFLHAYEKACLMGLPRQYRKVEAKSLKYRGSLNVQKHIVKDLPFCGKLSVSYREQKVPQEIINVLYCAVKNLSKSAYNVQKVKRLEQELKHQVSCKSVTSLDIQKALKCSAIQNPMFAQFKKVLKYAEIILKRKNLEPDSKISNSEVSGFLMDASELWEIYLEKILEDNFPDWNISGQSRMPFYEGITFFGRTFFPDLILEKNGNYAVFDAKFKDMYGRGWDVDREDLHQIHMYAGHFSKYGNLIAAGLLYPCSKTPEKNWSAELNTYTRNESLFAIDGINIGGLQDLPYDEAFDKLLEEEKLFVERMRTYLK